MGNCGKTLHLEVISLNMFPDPIPEARKIDQWRAFLRSDSSNRCLTTVAVVIEGQSTPITAERPAEAALGANEILLYTLDNYRLSGDRLCFELIAYINGNKTTMKSPRATAPAPSTRAGGRCADDGSISYQALSHLAWRVLTPAPQLNDSSRC